MSTVRELLQVDGIGSRGDAVAYEVTGEALRRYAAATDDQPGRTPAVFAIVPVWDAIAPASRRVASDEARKRVVHASQDMVLHRPLEAGMKLVSTATPAALLRRGSGTALVIHTETRTVGGELVNEQWVTEFFRGVETAENRGEPPAGHRLPDDARDSEPLAEISRRVAPDQPDRYAEASGDRFEIHLDDDAARAVGLPGRILHGFCTLAFTAQAVSDAAEGGELRRLAARFSAPVFPGDELRTRVWDLGGGAYGFEAACDDRIVLRDGLAVLA